MYTLGNNMASFDPARYDPARAVTVNRNGTLVPNSGDRYNGMARAGDGVPQDELFRVAGGDSAAVLAVATSGLRGFYPNGTEFGPRFSLAWTTRGGSGGS